MALLIAFGAAAQIAFGAASQTWANEARIYRYTVHHPTYGQIGTYTNVIQGPDSDARVTSELHIAVKVLGVTVYREDATRTEQWHGNRITHFDGVTVTNSHAVRVSGEAKGSHFVIASATGTALAPADVKTSNPWSISMLGNGTMMSTKTGKVFQTHVVAGQIESISDDGKGPRARRYDVISDKREAVWFDDRGVPVAFGTEHDGARIMFVLAGS